MSQAALYCCPIYNVTDVHKKTIFPCKCLGNALVLGKYK